MIQIDYKLIDSEKTLIGLLELYSYIADSGESGYEIRIDDSFLMGTHGALGEVFMANAARARLADDAENLSVLIGGLGAGHTLTAVLSLPGVTKVTVAEIGAKVVLWNRKYFADTNNQAVFDNRVNIIINDLAVVLKNHKNAFDLMLLDVDNGPDWLAAKSNAALYETSGLEDCKTALKLDGVLAIWSPDKNMALLKNMKKIFANVEELSSKEINPNDTGPADIVYLAENVSADKS